MKLAVLVVAGVVVVFMGMFFYGDRLEDKCEQQVDTLNLENPDQLVESISQEERDRLELNGLIPTQRYFEIRKCMYSND